MTSSYCVIPKVITLGQGTAEPIPLTRLVLYEQIAREFFGGNCGVRAGAAMLTIYLSVEQIVRGKAGLIREPIRKVPEPADCSGTIVIVDLTVNEPSRVSEDVLVHVSEAIGEMVSQPPEKHVIIMLPIQVDGSEMWSRLERWSFDQGSVTVLTDDGTVVRLNPDGSRPDVAQRSAQYLGLMSEYAENSLPDRFAAKVVRHVGHYHFGSSDNGEPAKSQCSRFFFDASFAVVEATELLCQRLDLLNLAGENRTLLTYSRLSPWLEKVAAAAAIQLGMTPAKLSSIDSPNPSELAGLTGRRVVVLVDVVNTYGTVTNLIRLLRDRGISVEETIISVFGIQTTRTLRVNGGRYQVFCLHEVDREPSPQGPGCGRCAAEQEHVHPLLDRYPGIRAYDFWEIMFDFDWEPERYGPADLPKFASAPNFVRIFREYGDWLAYKIDKMLATIGVPASASDEIVYVCPDEAAMHELMKRLKARRGGRPVAVHIPRPVLDDLASSDTVDREALPQSDWRRQIELLADRLTDDGAPAESGVVVLDEFSASGQTARTMVRILRALGISPLAYLSIANRGALMRSILGVPARSLYDLPSQGRPVP